MYGIFFVSDHRHISTCKHSLPSFLLWGCQTLLHLLLSSDAHHAESLFLPSNYVSLMEFAWSSFSFSSCSSYLVFLLLLHLPLFLPFLFLLSYSCLSLPIVLPLSCLFLTLYHLLPPHSPPPPLSPLPLPPHSPFFLFFFFPTSNSFSPLPFLPLFHRHFCVSAWGLGDCGRAALPWQRAMLPNCGTPGIWSLSLFSPLFIPPSSQVFLSFGVAVATNILCSLSPFLSLFFHILSPSKVLSHTQWDTYT